jgi:pimeloyl-ACP methyl ester carboxylesterase
MQQGRFVDLPSTEIHAVDSGGPGTPFLLIHGLGGNHANWVEVFEPLAERGRVIAVDLPGYGFSPPIESHELEHLRDVLIELLETLDRPAHLVGNSMGGLLAEMVTSERRDLVDELVLLAPASPVASLRHRPKNAVAARLAAQSVPGLGNLVVGAYRRMLTPQQRATMLLDTVAADASKLPERVVTTSVAMAARRDALPWGTRSLVESTVSIRRMFVPPNRFNRLIASIDAQALVLSGGHDIVVAPEAIDSLQTLRPDWTFHRKSDVGHVPQMEAADWVVAEIDGWLSRDAQAARAT